jgi:phenylalanine-4-hydroxylase
MFEEAQLYSPVTTDADGRVEVHLGAGHPGLNDPAYRARRGEIAAAALAWEPGTPVPLITYTPTEDEVWAVASDELAPKHQRYAHSEYLRGKAALGLPTDRVPQLGEVTESLHALTGWTYVCAPGLVGLRDFYGSLGDRIFHSTQYLRHPSQPLYTPEPDIIHEVIGHANQLASPRFARLTEAAGKATQRLESDAAVKVVADVFWFSMEFGVMWEAGILKAYGAGILSSYGEMDAFSHMEIRPLNLEQMATVPYDITTYQSVLFASDNLDQLEDVVGGFFDSVDDEAAHRLLGAHAHTG